jgi:transposase-like protein
MAGVRSQINDFEIEEFFCSSQTLLSSSFNNNISYDSAEYLSCRLDVYERNINILLARLSESYPLEQQLLADMHTVQVIVHCQRERCEALSFHSFLDDEHGSVDASVGVTISGVGRPRLNVSQQVIETLNSQVRLSWAEIARHFGVSESTIRRRRRSFGSTNTNRESHSTISDNDLDLVVHGILRVTPRIGYRLVQGALRRRGLRIQRRRVLDSLQRVDPVTVSMRASRSIVRRCYSVTCPNALW